MKDRLDPLRAKAAKMAEPGMAKAANARSRMGSEMQGAPQAFKKGGKVAAEGKREANPHKTRRKDDDNPGGEGVGQVGVPRRMMPRQKFAAGGAAKSRRC